MSDVGFPIARCVAILSLATAAIMDLAVGPYSGKETGETALLRELLDAFDEGDLVVADRFYGSFMMLALLLARGIDGCVRMHQNRHVDFRARVNTCFRFGCFFRPACASMPFRFAARCSPGSPPAASRIAQAALNLAC